MTFDISDPQHVVAKKFLNNVFPQRNNFYSGNTTNPDSVRVVVAFAAKDTTMDCESFRNWNGCPFCLYATDLAGGTMKYYANNAAAPAPGGKGGSMARFALIYNNLFTVTSTDLNVFNISNPQDPVFSNSTKIADWSIETIFPFKDKLFIGSNSGMFIYDVSNPAIPAKLGQFSHVRTCDPVIADNDYAYVTLRSGNGCAGFTNQLEVLNITDLLNPLLVKTYMLTNPRGLSKDENLLFICDGKDGVKVYDATDVNNLSLLKQITGIETYDVITWNKIALVVATDGLYQYDYSDIKNIKFLSKIGL